MPDRELTHPQHETTDAHSNAIAWTGLALCISAVVMQIVLGAVFFGFHRHFEATAVPVTRREFVSRRQPAPEPRLQTDSAGDLAKYLAAEDKRLSTYGWIDRKKGVARIPISRAMELIVQQRATVGETSEGASQ